MENSNNVVPVMNLRQQMQNAQQERSIRTGFETAASFELLQREAKLLSRSEMVPEMFRDQIMVKKGAQKGTYLANPSALSNCVLALNMANRLDMDVLMLMKNLLMIQGNLSWSSQYVIAAINRSGRFSAVQYRLSDAAEEETMEYEVREWNDQARRMETQKKKITFRDQTCVAWATEKQTNERVESPEVSLRMAVLEGWYGKEGSKWKTMPGVMLRYRAASFFGKLYTPEAMMGLPSEDEVRDTATSGVLIEVPMAEVAPQNPGGTAETGSAATEKENAAPGIPSEDEQGSVAQPATPPLRSSASGTARPVVNARRSVRKPDAEQSAASVNSPGPRIPPKNEAASAGPNIPFDELSDEELLAMDDQHR
ncbi:recombinase RecT [Acidithiobacillus sp. MC6.1]|nr:recombinase RecT [Acidithiobacillus sp. MC6.1]